MLLGAVLCCLCGPPTDASYESCYACSGSRSSHVVTRKQSTLAASLPGAASTAAPAVSALAFCLHAMLLTDLLVILQRQQLTGAAAQTAGLSNSARKQIGFWLAGCSGWVFSMVVLGGMTRLTRSGLSMTDWKFTGETSPQSLVHIVVQLHIYIHLVQPDSMYLPFFCQKLTWHFDRFVAVPARTAGIILKPLFPCRQTGKLSSTSTSNLLNTAKSTGSQGTHQPAQLLFASHRFWQCDAVSGSSADTDFT